MTATPTTNKFSEEEIVALRERVGFTINTQSLSQATVAREAEIAAGTLSGFLSGRGTADPQPVAAKLERWLEARRDREAIHSQVLPEPKFVQTGTAEDVQALLRTCQALSDMGVVVGPPGVGKTMAANEYRQRGNRVAMVTCSTMMSSAVGIITELLDVLGVSKSNGLSKTALTQAVRRKVGEGWLLIIDEAQHADQAAIEELRAIHDARGCAIVLIGNPEVIARIQGTNRSLGQLYSRFGQRLTLKGTTPADVAAVLPTMGIVDQGLVELSEAIGVKESLRAVVKVVRHAHLLASGSDGAMTKRHVTQAYRRLGGDLTPREAAAA